MRKITVLADAVLTFVVFGVLKLFHIYNGDMIFQLFLVMVFAIVSLYTFLIYKLPENMKKFHLGSQIIAIVFMIISILYITMNKGKDIENKIESSYFIFNALLPILIDFVNRKFGKNKANTITS